MYSLCPHNTAVGYDRAITVTTSAPLTDTGGYNYDSYYGSYDSYYGSSYSTCECGAPV